MAQANQHTVVTLASMKGGVGKTTLTTLLARYLVEIHQLPVLVLDLDPQRGATLLLLGPQQAVKYQGFTTLDILLSEQAGIPSSELVLQALLSSSYHPDIWLIPACAGLGRLAGPHTRRDLLQCALQGSARLPASLILVDSGPDISLCELSLQAADLVFIPMTLSHQSGIPTLNTLQAALSLDRPIGGLIPTMVGRAGWNQDRIHQWRHNLEHSTLMQNHNISVLPDMP